MRNAPFIGTHNSFNSVAEMGLTTATADPNQQLSIVDQLNLDIRAIEYMTTRLRAAAARGIAVLLISTELEELVALADRIAVIHRGHVVGAMDRDQLDLARLGRMMGGST